MRLLERQHANEGIGAQGPLPPRNLTTYVDALNHSNSKHWGQA